MAPRMNRRRLLVLASAGALAASLAGCGFQLRRPPEMRFATLAFTGFRPGSPLAEELRRQVATSLTTRVVDGVGQAQVVLEAFEDIRDKTVVASGAAGQVREVQLRARLRFLVRTQDGRSLIAPTEIVLNRDMSFNERDALAKEYEEDALFRAMNGDIASQVLRRLEAVRLPA